MLRLRTSGTTQRIRVTALVQAATLEKGVRDFLFDAFLHVARHERPPLATPDGESPPPTGDPIWVPPIDSGRHLVGHPMPGRVDTKGRIRYHEPDMAQSPPSATPSDFKEWEREAWGARMASLSNFRHHIPGDVPTPDDQQPAPSTYMTLMYNLHYTLSTSHYDAPTGHWVVHGTDSLRPADYAPPPAQPRPRTRTPGRTSRTTPTSGARGNASPWTHCSPSAAATRALVGRCIALPSGPNRPGGSPRTGGCGRSRCAPQQREAPTNHRGPTRPRPSTLQLCPYMVAARLMALLWPGLDTPSQTYPHVTEEDMPRIQRCFFITLNYLQQTHPHVLDHIWTPLG